MLETFVLVGTILSHDPVFSTVEFNINPEVNGGPAIAVMPNSAIPCKIEVGKIIYVVKNKNEDHTTVSCKVDKNENR